MGLSWSLGSFFLVCLLALACRSIDDNKVDIKTLARIIQFFEENYSKKDNNFTYQYTVAINVPKEQCKENFNPGQSNFLTNEIAANVKKQIYDNNVCLYEGKELIASGVRKRT